MRAANDGMYRVIADGLIHDAECLPKGCDAARLLREAAGNLLDADSALDRLRAEMLAAANDAKPGEAAA